MSGRAGWFFIGPFWISWGPQMPRLRWTIRVGRALRARASAAEAIGREGMVTVWDEHGCYLGCMGFELWKHLLTVSHD